MPDMHCQGCLETVRANLALEDGVGDVRGDLKTKKVRIAYRSEATSPKKIETAIARLGYRPKDKQAEPA